MDNVEFSARQCAFDVLRRPASLFEFEADDRTDEETFGFIASMNWSPGYLAAERLVTRVFPKVRARRPNAKLLHRCARNQALRQLNQT